MRNWCQTLVCLCALTSMDALAQGTCPYTFDPPITGPEALFDAVFSIGEVSGDGFEHLGTAYLIDAEHRYLLTAEHVVRHASVGETVDARSDTYGSREFVFEILAKDRAKDLALLRPVSGTIPPQLRAFDVRMKIPASTENLYIVGHPRFLDDHSRTFAAPTYRRYRTAAPLIGTFELEGNTLKGASGSPLFDAYGQALGTITDNSTDRQLGFARPSHDTQDLLLKHYELSSLGSQLHQAIQRDSTSVEYLAGLLSAKPTNASNLDLMKIAHAIIADPSGYPDTTLVFFSCPLLQSMLHRGLSVPRSEFVVRLLEKAKNDAILLGDQKVSLGDKNSASSYYSLAYEASIQAIHQLARNSDEISNSIRCGASAGGISAALTLPNDLSSTITLPLDHVEEDDCELTKPSNRIGRLLADASRAGYSMWRTSDREDILASSRRFAALAILVSDNPQVLGDAYASFGIASVDMNQVAEGRRALGLAYINGVRQPWLEDQIELYNLDLKKLKETKDDVLEEYAEIALIEGAELDGRSTT